MPYAPFRRGPLGAAIAALVAVIALALGITTLLDHRPVRGAILLIAATAALLVAALARRPPG